VSGKKVQMTLLGIYLISRMRTTFWPTLTFSKDPRHFQTIQRVALLYILRQWTVNDGKIKASIILAINPSELRQVKGYETLREVRLKLEDICQSREAGHIAEAAHSLTDV